jgi:hypothetical protein
LPNRRRCLPSSLLRLFIVFGESSTCNGETFSSEAFCCKAFSSKTLCGETFRGETFRGETFRGETFRGETLCGETLCGETLSDTVSLGVTAGGSSDLLFLCRDVLVNEARKRCVKLFKLFIVFAFIDIFSSSSNFFNRALFAAIALSDCLVILSSSLLRY